MGYGDLSITGNRDVRTENIDRLAEEGIRFTQFYVASPICSPSRVAFTTGRSPAFFGIHSFLASRARNAARGMRDFLDPRATSVARSFQQAGYATAHFGKWHMGGGRDVGDAPLPQAYGFDESLVSFEGLGDRVLPPGEKNSAKLGRGDIRRAEKHRLTQLYVDRSIDFIHENRGRPFYLHLWLNDVHDAHRPSPEMLSEVPGFVSPNPYVRKFYAVLDDMDTQIGRLIDAIDGMGLAERTLVVLTSDNGPTAWARYYEEGLDPPGSTGGYRGRKWSLYEGGIRMPLIVRCRGKVPEGVVDETTVCTAVDYLPTVCSLAGLPVPDNALLDGEDLSGAWLGRARPRSKPIYWEYGRDSSYLKPGRERDRSPNLAMRDGDWKLLANADGTRVELYNLAHDAQETTNMADKEPRRRAEMLERLMQWRSSIPQFQSPHSEE